MNTAAASPPGASSAHAKTIAIKAVRVLVWLVYAWVVITLVLLFLAFLLQLLGANPTAGFVEWVYRSTERAMAPFRGIFEPVALTDKSTLDVSILFAMIVYSFVALGINVALDWLGRKLYAAQTEEHRLEQEAKTAGSRVVQLTGPGTSATAVLTAQGAVTLIDLTITGLQPAQAYGAWLQTSDGARASAGTFQPATAGTVRVSLTCSVHLSDCHMFGVTLQPQAAGGAATDVVATRL